MVVIRMRNPFETLFRRGPAPKKEAEIVIETVNPLAQRLQPSKKRLEIKHPGCNPEIYVRDGSRKTAILTWNNGTTEVRLTEGVDSVLSIDYSAQRVGCISVAKVDKYRDSLSTGGKIALAVNHAVPVGLPYHKEEGYKKVA